MKTIILLALCGVALADDYVYIPKDPYNMDTLASNPAEIKLRVDCLLNRGPCSDLYSVYRSLQPVLIRQECAYCSPYIKQYFKVFLAAFKNNFPEDYEEYKKKYDPEGLHFGALEATIAEF